MLSENGYNLGIYGACDSTYATSLGAACFHAFTYARQELLTPQQSYNLDAKIDDGIPEKGFIKSAYTWGGDRTARLGKASAGKCMSGTSPNPNYDVSHPDIECNLWIKTQF